MNTTKKDQDRSTTPALLHKFIYLKITDASQQILVWFF